MPKDMRCEPVNRSGALLRACEGIIHLVHDRGPHPVIAAFRHHPAIPGMHEPLRGERRDVFFQVFHQEGRHRDCTIAVKALRVLQVGIIPIKLNCTLYRQLSAFQVDVLRAQGDCFRPAEAAAIDEVNKGPLHRCKVGQLQSLLLRFGEGPLFLRPVLRQLDVAGSPENLLRQQAIRDGGLYDLAPGQTYLLAGPGLVDGSVNHHLQVHAPGILQSDALKGAEMLFKYILIHVSGVAGPNALIDAQPL